MPSLDAFKNGSQSDDVIMTDEKKSTSSSEISPDEFCPGRIIPVKSANKAQAQAQSAAAAEVGEVLDDGEIVEVQAPGANNQNAKNGVGSQFIEINKNRGASVFLNVTNLSSQRIRVIYLLRKAP